MMVSLDSPYSRSSSGAPVVRLGTRGSPLALAQTRLVAEALERVSAGIGIEIVPIATTGDRIQDRALAEAGGKGLFTKEIEDALLSGTIDAAVHSMKDMPTVLPEGLVIGGVLPREDARDVLFCRGARADGAVMGLSDLPAGAVVGTASLRRQALVLAARPDLRVTVLRGNVGTRLQKLEDGAVDATLLALAGLKRLGAAVPAYAILPESEMLPAVAQGIVGVEIRADHALMASLLHKVNCVRTEMAMTAERAFLAVMDGSCRTPLAAYMSPPDPEGRARLDVMAARPDGRDVRRESHLMTVRHAEDAARLGRQAGESLLAKLPPGFIGAG